MHKRLMSLAAVIVALGGFALAITIPAASAAKAPHVTTTYCEDGSTVYGEYSECPTTTSTTPPTTTTTATATTSTDTTPITTTTASTPTTTTSTTPATPDYTTLTQAEADAILSAIPGITIGADGISITDPADLPVGISLAPGVVVEANADGSVTISDNGVVFIVPDGAQLTVAPDGVASVTADGITKTYPVLVGKTPGRVAHVVKATANVGQFVIMPKSRTTDTFSYTLPKGASFGKATWAKIAGAFKVYAITNTKTRAGIAQKFKVATNKARTAITIKTSRYIGSYSIVFNLKGLTYTAAEKKAIKAGKNTLTINFAATSKKGATVKKDRSKFTYIA